MARKKALILNPISKARVRLNLGNPLFLFFANLAMRLDIVADPECPTAKTDGRTLWYNPEWVGSLKPAEVEGLVAHEVWHCVYDHLNPLRIAGRDMIRWNMAGDLRINADLKDFGFTLPEGCLYDKKYDDGWHTERIFNDLPQPKIVHIGTGQGKGKGKNGQPGNGECYDPRYDKIGHDIVPMPGKQAKEAENQAAQWKAAVSQAAARARQAGKLPGGLDRFVDDLLEPEIDFEQILRRFIMEAIGHDDMTWHPPDRRFVQMEEYLPTWVGYTSKPVVFGIDTSGSIGSKEIKKSVSEVEGFLQTYKIPLYLVYIDAAVQSVEIYDGWGQRSVAGVTLPKGGGGTDFRPLFQWVEKEGLDITCMVYFTDLYGTFPEEEPDYPVMWVAFSDLAVPFGEVVRVTPEY